MINSVDVALTDIYVAQYPRLIQIATTLLDDTDAAEEVAQDAYIRVWCGWDRVRDPQAAAAYLRTTVLNITRSRMRRRVVAAKHPPEAPPNVPSAEDIVIDRLECDRVVVALRALPRRQQECLALRYYANLSELQIATMLGISVGAVKSHSSRGTRAMQRRLQAYRPLPTTESVKQRAA